MHASDIFLAGDTARLASFAGQQSVRFDTTDPVKAKVSCYDFNGPLPFQSNFADTVLTLSFLNAATGYCVFAPNSSARTEGRPTVSVKDFGAYGDGAHNDYDAMRTAAASICVSGGTLVYPPGQYYIQNYRITGGPDANGVRDIVYQGCHDVLVSGYGATIIVNGAFVRTSDYSSAGLVVSYRTTVIPFDLLDCERITVAGFELVGGVQSSTRDPGVIEGTGHGIRTSHCIDCAFSDLTIHHFQTDGLCLGCGSRADRNIELERVATSNNARMGLTVAQVSGALVRGCSFRHNGRTGGAYLSHAPAAGVDVEPNFAPPKVDRVTGELIFANCTFENNLGGQFISANARAIESVVVTGSTIIANMPDVSSGAYLNIARLSVTELSSFQLSGTAAITIRPVSDLDYAAIQKLTVRGNSFVVDRALALSGSPKTIVPIEFLFNTVTVNAARPDVSVARLRNLSTIGCNEFFVSGKVLYPFNTQQTVLDYTGTDLVFQNAYRTDVAPGRGFLIANYDNVRVIDHENFQAPVFVPNQPLHGSTLLPNLPAGVAAPSCSWSVTTPPRPGRR